MHSKKKIFSGPKIIQIADEIIQQKTGAKIIQELYSVIQELYKSKKINGQFWPIYELDN